MTESLAVAGIPMLNAVALKTRFPAVSTETMRWLPVSDTQMVPSGATVTPHGALNGSCVPVPTGVEMTVHTPAGELLWMRSLRVSATQTVPYAATAMPVGLLRSPAGAAEPMPFFPYVASQVALVSPDDIAKASTRSLPESST